MNKAIFGPKAEFLNLILPVIFLNMVFLEYFFHQDLYFGFSHFEASIIANIIFLNITHNAFTFILLTSTLPLKVWIEHHGGARKFWTEQGIVFLLLTIFFTGILFLSYHSRVSFIAFGAIGFSFAAHHALSQIFGLSLIYTKDVAGKNVKADRIERMLFKSFMYLNLLAGNFFLLSYYKIFHLPTEVFQLLFKGVLSIGLILAIALILHPYYFYKKEYLSKSIFNLRYLLWPLTLISSFAIFSTLILHGVEYGLVTNKMIRSDSLRRPVLAVSIISLVIVFAFIRLDSIGDINIHKSISPWLLFATGLSIAFSFLHYYLDRKLFKMRHQINRDLVAPMLFNGNTDDK